MKFPLSAAQRKRLYAVAAALAALATGYGLVTDDKAALWLALVGAAGSAYASLNTSAKDDDEAPKE